MSTTTDDAPAPPAPFALVTAARLGNADALQQALQQGCVPDLEDFEARTALSWVAAQGNDAMVDQLLAHGASPDRPNRFGRTPLMFAAELNRHSVVQRLLAAGADVHRRDGRGHTALGLALALAVRQNRTLRMPPGTPPRPRLPPWRRVNASARWLWQAGARPPAAPAWWHPLRGRLNAALRADEFDEFGSPLGTRWLLLPLLASLVLAVAISAAQDDRLPPSTWRDLLYACVGLAVAAWAALRALLQFPSAVQWLARRGAPGLRQEVARASAPVPPPALAHLDAMTLGQLLARRSVALRRELGAEPDDVGALPLRLGRHADAAVRWLLVALLYMLVLAWPVWKDGTPVTAALAAVAMLAVARRERQARQRRLQHVQARADRNAAALARPPDALALDSLADHTDANPPAPADALAFALYLRPFYTTAQVPVGGVDFESLLAYALSSTLPLVALGRPGEHIGAGRIATHDAHWQQQVGTLLDRASAIICIPSARPGTLWELQQLRTRRLLEKTVFIMPRDFIVQRLPGRAPHQFSADWAETVTAAAGAGLVLPAFQLRGLLFELDAEGRLLRHLPFRADPNLRLIAGLASAARLHDPIARSDSDAASDPNNDRDDAAPYDVDGMSIDTAPGDAFDTGWFDADGPQAGLSADGAGADVPGADNDGPGDGDRGGQ